MWVSTFLSMRVNEESTSEDREVNYSLLSLIIDKDIFNCDNGWVEMQLDGLYVGVDQKASLVQLYYSFLQNSNELLTINKDLQVGQFYNLSGFGMPCPDPSEIWLPYPNYDRIELKYVPLKLFDILRESISKNDLYFQLLLSHKHIKGLSKKI